MTLLNTEIDERALAKASLENAEENLRKLCASQAPTFVAVERRGALLTSALHTLLKSIDDATPNVQNAKQSLLEQSNTTTKKKDNEEKTDDIDMIMKDDSKCNNLSTLTERHRIRRRTLLQHSALLELLELPSLMDACVRSNLYEDALSVATFANSLERRHSQDSNTDTNGHNNKHTVVSNVVSEVRMREHDLRRHLLQRLRCEMTMPQCLEVVTALRRLNGVELERKNNTSASIDLESLHAAMELSLIVDFFEARDLWLDSPSSSSSTASNSGNNNGPLSSITLGTQGSAKTAQSEQLLDMIERYRTRCFEIATQFLAIFHTSSSSTTPTLGNDHGAATSLSLLSLWTTRRIQMFLKTLTNQLSRINDCAILRDALDATVFFSTSMGRIGADFQALLPPIFEPQLLYIVTVNNWEENGIITLEKTLNICRDAGVASPLYTPNSNINKEEDDNTINATQSKDSSSTPSPPRILLSYPPLARLVNAYLTGLNELRRCLLPGIFQPLQEIKLPSFISKVKQLLQVHERAVLTPGLKGEATKLRQIANDMKSIFEEVVQPYLEMSLLVALGLYVEPPPPHDKDKDEEENKDTSDDADGDKESATNEEDKIDTKENNDDTEEKDKSTKDIDDKSITEEAASDKEGQTAQQEE